jgi:hypothetical protein
MDNVQLKLPKSNTSPTAQKVWQPFKFPGFSEYSLHLITVP